MIRRPCIRKGSSINMKRLCMLFAMIMMAGLLVIGNAPATLASAQGSSINGMVAQAETTDLPVRTADPSATVAAEQTDEDDSGSSRRITSQPTAASGSRELAPRSPGVPTVAPMDQSQQEQQDVEAAATDCTPRPNAILSGCVYNGMNLAGANFSGSDLTAATFNGANVSGSNFSNANLTSATFDGANLSCSNFNGANLTSTTLNGANLSGSTFNGATFTSTTWGTTTTCPDGTTSGANAATCLDNLQSNGCGAAPSPTAATGAMPTATTHPLIPTETSDDGNAPPATRDASVPTATSDVSVPTATSDASIPTATATTGVVPTAPSGNVIPPRQTPASTGGDSGGSVNDNDSPPTSRTDRVGDQDDSENNGLVNRDQSEDNGPGNSEDNASNDNGSEDSSDTGSEDSSDTGPEDSSDTTDDVVSSSDSTSDETASGPVSLPNTGTGTDSGNTLPWSLGFVLLGMLVFISTAAYQYRLKPVRQR